MVWVPAQPHPQSSRSALALARSRLGRALKSFLLGSSRTGFALPCQRLAEPHGARKAGKRRRRKKQKGAPPYPRRPLVTSLRMSFVYWKRLLQLRNVGCRLAHEMQFCSWPACVCFFSVPYLHAFVVCVFVVVVVVVVVILSAIPCHVTLLFLVPCAISFSGIMFLALLLLPLLLCVVFSGSRHKQG